MDKELRDKRCLVVGMGASGMAAAEFLIRKGASVLVSEQKHKEELGPPLKHLLDLGADVETGGHTLQRFLGAELIVLSPGVDPSIHPLVQARKKGVPIISEVELASWYIDQPIIAITGTNGKSTTTSLIGHILFSWGKRVFIGGNIGTPLTTYLLQGKAADYIVAEVSSFQLETIHSFRPWIAILLNIGEDHLSRHPTPAAYAAAKARLFANQGEKDWSILNADDIAVMALVPKIRSRIVTFSRQPKGGVGVWLQEEAVLYRLDREEGKIPLAGVKLKGIHNRENIMAACAAAIICGAPPSTINGALITFTPLEHRLEPVGEWEGVSFYNDSKATNVAAAVTSLAALDGPIILLAGGRDKGGDYAPLRSAMAGKVKALILMGEAKDKMREALNGTAPIYLAEGMQDGVRHACQIAEKGDTVLLAPACSSFDMFANYEERGRAFKAAVRQIAGGKR